MAQHGIDRAGRAAGDLARAGTTEAAATGRRLVAVLAAASGLVLVVLACLAAGRLAADDAAADLGERARAALPLATAALVGEIDKQRLIPLTLSRDPAVAALLRDPSGPAEAELDGKLRAIAAEAQAAVIYVVDAHGRAIAASNAGEPASFVGSDYGFRHYFRDAMETGSGAQYALGTVSGRPGLYLTRRVDGPEGPLGVVVVKVELDGVEARWRASGFVVTVADRPGIVVATSVPAWRFGTLPPLAEEAAAPARERLQIGDLPLSPLPLRHEGEGRVIAEIGERAEGFVAATEAVGPSAPGWTLTLLVPADTALANAERSGRITMLLALLLAGGVAVALWRRRRAVRLRQETLARMNAALEARVDVRTEELRRSNDALAGEIAERAAAEEKVRRLRDELAQANRLSILGQIAAGVAHEMNQPLAAIRVYAENAKRFLASDGIGAASSNLDAIAGLTERIATITESLRSFARRAGGPIGALPVEDAVDGALSLVSGRIRETGATIRRMRRDPSPRVLASRIRLEQILVNLLQNALDALAGRPEPRIEIAVAETGETVRVTVRDNGPGIDPAIAANLFMPFTTSKEKGLGLGLVISEEIARELGGALLYEPGAGEGEGAAFTLELRRAP